MKAIVRESGSPPTISTFGTMNARNGAKTLADMLAPEEWADLAILTIDYDGDGFTPVLVIKAVKFFKGGRRLETEDWNISLEDAFGLDNFNNAVAIEIVQALKELMTRMAHEGPPSDA